MSNRPGEAPLDPASTWAFIGIGGNLGDAQAQVLGALDAIAALPGVRLVARSSLYRTAPIGAGGPDYVNAVASVQTTVPPRPLLQALQAIETRFGRERPYPNAPRTLDLDLLLYGDQVLQDPELTVPHPRLHMRAFVLVPLVEVAPDLLVPGRGAVRDLLPGVSGQAITRLG